MLRPRPPPTPQVPGVDSEQVMSILRGIGHHFYLNRDFVDVFRIGVLSQEECDRVRSALATAFTPSSSLLSPSSAAPTKNQDVKSAMRARENDPIGFGISPNFSYAKQCYFERHEGLKVAL